MSGKKNRNEKDDRSKKIRETQTRSSYDDKNPERHLSRGLDQRTTVSDLVYRYLNKIEYLRSRLNQSNNAYKKFRRNNARRKKIQGPSTLCKVPKYTRKLSSFEKSWLETPTILRTLEKDRKSVKSYIREALLFGLQSGYLTSTDRKGKVLHLSSSLTLCHTN